MMTSDKPPSFRPLQVSNGYINIDIDNIRDPPGEDFETWIEITKEKLKERESRLMSARISALQNIINEQCAAFETAHSSLQFGGRSVSAAVADHDRVLHSGVIEECLNKLSLSLQLWHGVNLSKTKKSLSTFREYFVIGKCWFDQKKKSILAPDFWIKILCVLDHFTEEAADFFFQGRCPRVQTLFRQHLRFQMISGIFTGQLHFAETKPQPLIPCSIIKDSRSMKEYLVRLHPTLNVDRMMKVHGHGHTARPHIHCTRNVFRVINDALRSFSECEAVNVPHSDYTDCLIHSLRNTMQYIRSQCGPFVCSFA